MPAPTRITEIWEKLQAGDDFAATAISYSEAPEALEGGRVGWRDLSSIPTAFADTIRELGVGQFSQPIRSPGGFHILKVNDKRETTAVMIQEYNAQHIMVEPSAVLDSNQSIERITDIKQRLDAGEDFGELAREYSDDETSANLGGDMGWFPPDSYGQQVQQTLESLEPGEISEPFQSQVGWHIMKLIAIRDTDMTEEAIRENARQTIQQRRADEEVEAAMRTMRDEAYVEIRLPT